MWGSAPPERVEIQVRDLDADRGAPQPSPAASGSAPLSMGWLLRLFRSDFFDAFMAVTYLYRYRDSRGVHDYLCNELYQLSDADLEAFMPQVCNLLVWHARDSPGLERFVMDKCAESMHMAVQVYWFLQAAVEDATRENNREAESRCRLLRTRCETAAVNGSHHAMLTAAAARVAGSVPLVAADPPFSTRPRVTNGCTLFPSSSAGRLHVTAGMERAAEMDGEGANASGDEGGGEGDGDGDGDGNGDGDGGKGGKSSKSGEDGEDGEDDDGGAASTDEIPVAGLAANDDDMTAGGKGVVQDASALMNDLAELQLESADLPAAGKASALVPESDPTSAPSVGQSEFDPMALLTMKQERFDYFNDSLSIAKTFVKLSLSTRELPQSERQGHLMAGLEKINELLLRRMNGELSVPLVADTPPPDPEAVARLGVNAALRSVHLPLTRASSPALRILRVNSEEAVILNSRTRAPYLINVEVLATDMLCSDRLLFCEHIVENLRPDGAMISLATASEVSVQDTDMPIRTRPPVLVPPSSDIPTQKASSGTSGNLPVRPTAPAHVRRLSEMSPEERQRANIRKVVYGDAYTRQPEIFSQAEEASDRAADTESADYKSRQAVLLGVYGELWSWKEERILKKSPFRSLKGARLMPFIVKAGDDLRQEQLAIQLIAQFEWIFKKEGVDVFLRPFTVMSVSSDAGLVEVIPDAVSVHSLKKRIPNFVSLLDYFERAFGANGSRSFRAAQRRFIRSMAGYSLVTYFLQIKDRHNGNIMLDAKGHIVHIDFGFMLTNSPGAIKFENVPFKLTEEYLQVICAKKNVQNLSETSKTEGYRYFQELIVMGLLAARKHNEKIVTLVEIMTEGTSMPCMTGGHAVVESLRSRFALGTPEEQCINFALKLIEDSRLSWRSSGYDAFQAYSNGYA